MFMMLYDLEKAFDCIEYCVLLDHLYRTGIEANPSSQVHLRNSLSKPSEEQLEQMRRLQVMIVGRCTQVTEEIYVEGIIKVPIADSCKCLGIWIEGSLMARKAIDENLTNAR